MDWQQIWQFSQEHLGILFIVASSLFYAWAFRWKNNRISILKDEKFWGLIFIIIIAYGVGIWIKS